MMKSMNQWLVFALGLVNLCTSDFLRGYPPCAPSFHLVPITLMQGAAAKGAVCLDGSVPAYHLDPGFGPGANNWLVHLEGGGWCKDEKTCSDRKRTPRGSSNYMEKEILFTGILTNNPEENPGFRQDMVDSVKGFLMSNKTGIFLNSCFTHCQFEPRETWFPYANPPTILNKTIAESVGDWYFDRAQSKAVDYPYPSNRSCCNLLFKDGEPFQLQCANNC